MIAAKTDLNSQFVFNRASDDSVDSEYVLLANTSVTIQCAPYAGGYVVNDHGGEGADFWCRDHGIHRSLDAAMQRALKVAGALRSGKLQSC